MNIPQEHCGHPNGHAPMGHAPVSGVRTPHYALGAGSLHTHLFSAMQPRSVLQYEPSPKASLHSLSVRQLPLDESPASWYSPMESPCSVWVTPLLRMRRN